MTEDIFTWPSDELSLSDSDTLPLTSAESFVEEERHLLWSRCRLVFVLGLAISLVLILLSRLVIDRPREAWESLLDMTHLASFGLALVSLYWGTPSTRRLQLTAFAVVALNAILVVFSVGVVESDYPPELAVALILFIPAAVIPWRVRYQVALGVIAVASPVLARVLSYVLIPGTRSTIAAWGRDPRFFDELMVTTVTLLILAATSVLVTHTLYSLRRKARRAKRLGNYLIERELGKGGMGEVFVARHARMVRPTAVKVVRVSGTFDEEVLGRFEREVQVSSSLTHPNTITIYDYGRADRNTFYYAMEYLEGLDLKRLVTRFGPVDTPRALYLLRQVCGSLSEAHARKIVHRDIKPANIFLTQRGGLFDYVKVLDFGLARQMRPGTGEGVTKTGVVVGTPEYMSPEAVHGEQPVDTRSDLYGLPASRPSWRRPRFSCWWNR
jgi:hypothetical protein